ncbi:hypothetical protein P4B35_07805 [Pontiellaceae bacterium B12227]|nr:hypothetical protein [Pontiellaceae bacterium B12227]
MKRGLLAILTAVIVAGVGTAQAAIVTNVVEDFSTFDRVELLWNSGDPQNADEILGGLGDNRWLTALNAAVYTNTFGKLLIKSSNDKSRVALYTITADQFSGPNPNAQLDFFLQNLQNSGKLEVAVFSIQNPGTVGNAVEYDVLGGPNHTFVTDGSGVGLQAVGSASVSMLISTNIGGLANNDPIEGAYTIPFAYNGADDIVIGFNCIGLSSAHKVATIDDVIVTTDDSVAFPAVVALDPAEELTMTFESTSVVTGTVAVSYTAGNPPANVEITSVSILSQTHAGAFENATALPLTISAPTPASEDVSIGFDNGIAGLAATETATGVVEIVWNEVGSATSNTSSVPVSATRLIGADNIIAAFDQTFTTADRKFPGVDAVISGGLGLNVNYGSIDTSYGAVLGEAPTAKNAMGASVNSPTVVVSITNTTPDTEVFFDSLNFDIGRRWTKAPNRVVVSIAGDIDNNASVTNHYGFNEITGTGPYLDDFDDFDIDLTGLSDRSLTYGQSASFTLTVSDPMDLTNPDSVLAIDNIALLGAVISPTLFVIDPEDELALNVDDPAGVVTGAVAVSYIEASSMPTNVTVTAVNIVSQSHAGAFSSASTNLPLMLTSPVVSENVLVEFNNATAGLAAGQTATGTMEIIWNEVGSASSSTSSLPVSAMYLDVNPGNTIALFEENWAGPTFQLGGLAASLSGYHGLNGSQGSTDGTFGSLAGEARTDGGAVQASLTYPVISLAITNTTGYDCTFDSLHFDAAKMWNKGLNSLSVSLAGDVTAVPVLTNIAQLIQFPGTAGDYDDFDIDLTGLADRTLAHGEAALIEFTFYNGDPSNSNAVSVVDNIALLGSGVNGAVMTKVPGGRVSMGVSSYTETISELIQMVYTEGDAETNVVITGVTFAQETHPGAFSYSGSLPLELGVPVVTNDIVTLVFDNTVANVAAGDYARAVMQIDWNEKGVGTRTFEFEVYATRAADVPTNGIIALMDTEFLTADAAVDGVLARMGGEGSLQYAELGSADGTYGSLATPAAPTGISRWRFSGDEQVATLTVTNGTVGDIELSTLNFDIGRWYPAGSDEFTLSVSGDVTDTPVLLVSSLSVMGFQNYDFDDHDVDLTTLADHILSAGESVTFTFTLTPKAGAEDYNTWIDNIALMGTFDQFGGWASSHGVPEGQNGPADNPDGDGKNNLMEYATNGDPMTPDSIGETWQAEEGGTNWFYYVHEERTDDASLTFSLGARGNLLFPPDWSGDELEEVGESVSSGGFKSVTNRTDMGNAEFIRLKVDQN